MYKKILLPVDNSEDAQRAGEYALSVADITGAEIIVLNIIDTDYLNALTQTELKETINEQLRKEGQTAIEKFEKKIEAEQCAGNCKNIQFKTLIKKGKPSDIILKTTDELNIDHIVMGKSGKHGLEKFLLGSTTERVVRGIKVPITIIP